MLRKVKVYSILAALAFASALNYHVFVFPNNFAPAGVDGICTMIQYVTKTNIGYLNLLFNIPLLVLAGIFLHRRYVIRCLVYIVVFSVSSIIIPKTGIFPVFLPTAVPAPFFLLSRQEVYADFCMRSC